MECQEQNSGQISNFLGEKGGCRNFQNTGLSAKGVNTRVLSQKRLFDQFLKNKCYVNRYPNKSLKNKIVDKLAFFRVKMEVLKIFKTLDYRQRG